MLQDNTREGLIQAAGPIFAERGCDAATTREICASAGTNIAAINYHFGGKRELYREAVRTAAATCMSAAPLPELPPSMSPAEKRYLFIRTLLERVIVDREPMWCGQLIMREMAQPTEACAEFVRGFIRPQFEILQAIIAEILPADYTVERRRMVAFSIVGQCLHYRFCRPVILNLLGEEAFRGLNAEYLARHISEFTKAALGMN